MKNSEELYHQALQLLKVLIATPSLSREEDETAKILQNFLRERGIKTHRKGNNVFAFNKSYDPTAETILLNSHHDTVKANSGYTRDPFEAAVEDGKLYGLGSNDAGGCLVALIAAFTHFYDKPIPFNLALACTAEEEISGHGGVESILRDLGPLRYGIIGEPTRMEMAVAEKGLLVLDGLAKGKAGHAARDIGENALYKAIADIEKLRRFQFDKESNHLGPIKVSVTQIEAGYQHNVIPDICKFVVDVRTTDVYTNEEVVRILQGVTTSDLNARSTRLRPSQMPENTPVYEAGLRLGLPMFGSATTSDQAVIPLPTIKMGPGMSERSHTPDEFIRLDELQDGIIGYIRLLEEIIMLYKSQRK